MCTSTPVFVRVDNAVREVCLHIEERRTREPNWQALGERNLWRELVACVLGSRVRHEVARSASQRLGRAGLLDPPHRDTRWDGYCDDLFAALSRSEVSLHGTIGRGPYPFARMRAAQICRAARDIYGHGETVRALLAQACDARDARRGLARRVAGVGLKQASLFLRNTGYSLSIAVLDSHVLTYMHWAGLLATPVQTVREIARYEALESRLVEHCSQLGLAPDCFDLAVWVVMRVAKREGILCQL